VADTKVLRWARVIQPMIPVEDNLRSNRLFTFFYGDGDWGNGRGNGAGSGPTKALRPLDRGCGNYGWSDGGGEAPR
jgi:hypothetical protein